MFAMRKVKRARKSTVGVTRYCSGEQHITVSTPLLQRGTGARDASKGLLQVVPGYSPLAAPLVARLELTEKLAQRSFFQASRWL